MKERKDKSAGGKGSKALRRALKTADAARLDGNLPAIVDTTELITPEIAQEMLKHNKGNRPVNWKRVERYADMMSAGKWVLHSQGIIFDDQGNLLTGQNRLWGVAYSKSAGVYMRVSRGNPPQVGKYLDRGMPQSARDLASRRTEEGHSPSEASIARAVCVLEGQTKPSTDDVADAIVRWHPSILAAIAATKGTRKTKSVLMVLAAIVVDCPKQRIPDVCKRVEGLSGKLDTALAPKEADACWRGGAAFGLAMENAREIVAAYARP